MILLSVPSNTTLSRTWNWSTGGVKWLPTATEWWYFSDYDSMWQQSIFPLRSSKWVKRHAYTFFFFDSSSLFDRPTSHLLWTTAESEIPISSLPCLPVGFKSTLIICVLLCPLFFPPSTPHQPSLSPNCHFTLLLSKDTKRACRCSNWLQ